MAAVTSFLAAGLIGASIFNTVSTLSQKGPKAPEAPKLPEPPKPEDTALETERELSRQKAKPRIAGTPSGRSSTLLTGPSGLSTPAPTERKTLLGY